ncbi:Flavoprotein [Magnetospirillum sp. UT-4]|nr:Flavoprotein [Magnetospirillum sp. UT-4]
MAAEALAAAGHAVAVYDSMASPARKFLRAGIGGLNLTHSEPFEAFLGRYGAAAGPLRPMLAAFGPEAVRTWAAGLGIDTFVGSSGRVFPVGMKAAPLLRAWLRRLDARGVRLYPRHRWLGWDGQGRHLFATPDGQRTVDAPATVLALGGASWPRLGSDGGWRSILEARGIAVAPFQPANCGFDADWSAHFAQRHAGAALKPVVLSFAGRSLRGEMVVTRTGIEGGAVYALSAALRDAIAASHGATLNVDLRPDWDLARLQAALARPRGSRSLSTHLERTAGLRGAAAGLLREVLDADTLAAPWRLAAAVKALPLRLLRPRPLAEAISTAGGVDFAELDDGLMLHRLPGTFVAGEMLDWEAPTGGYLLTASLATGRRAGLAAAKWMSG